MTVVPASALSSAPCGGAGHSPGRHVDDNQDQTDCFSKMLTVGPVGPVEAAVGDREFLGDGLSAADADDL